MGRVFVYTFRISRRTVLWLVLLLLALAALIAIWKFVAADGSSSALRSTGPSLFRIGRPPPDAVTMPVLSLDEAAPEFVLYTPGGDEWTPESWEETPYVLLFWASWCEECAEFVALAARVHTERTADSVKVVAVNVAESASRAADFAARHGFKMPVLYDPAGDAAAAFGVGLLPAAVMVDEDGFVRDRLFGNVSESLYVARLQAVTPVPPPPEP